MGGTIRTPMRARASMFSRWISPSGVARGTSTSGRRSFSVTSAARPTRPSAYPARMPARVFMEQGTTTMPSVRNEPEEMVAPWSSGACATSASAATSRMVRPVSSSTVARAQRLATRCVSTSGRSARRSSSRTPKGAPVAPVIATINRTAPAPFRSVPASSPLHARRRSWRGAVR
ncbi:hypothetical protein SFUMM280S_01962 [Streptomyces fumanus]